MTGRQRQQRGGKGERPLYWLVRHHLVDGRFTAETRRESRAQAEQAAVELRPAVVLAVHRREFPRVGETPLEERFVASVDDTVDVTRLTASQRRAFTDPQQRVSAVGLVAVAALADQSEISPDAWWWVVAACVGFFVVGRVPAFVRAWRRAGRLIEESAEWALSGDHVPQWWRRGSCAAPDMDPDLFFEPRTPAQLERAREVCWGCPVADDCLADAARGDRPGIRGGLTEQERAEIAALTEQETRP